MTARSGRSASSHRRDEGLSPGKRQAEIRNHAHAVGAWRKQSGAFGRWAFEEFKDVYEMDKEFNALIDRVIDKQVKMQARSGDSDGKKNEKRAETG